MAESDPPSKTDFFISYNQADRAWAEWVAWHLEESGQYTVVIQAWDFGPGCNFVLEMDRAIHDCGRVIAVFSPDYLTSLFTKPEWASYFVQDSTGHDRRIVPVRVRECEPKGLLGAIVYAEIVGKPENEAKAALLGAVKLGRLKPESAPGFPGRKIVSKPRFPGALPDIWNVPHLRNPNFTEPGQRLTELRDALHAGKPAALTQALAGLGGVGKTQLATEYAYRYAGDYDLVWWLRSEQPAMLAEDYAKLAAKLDLQEKNAPEQPVIVAAVREALLRSRNWLLIFDNANTLEEIRGYLPGIGGHILITSRHSAWGGLAQTMPVKKWVPDVAVEFLLKRTGLIDAAAAADLAQEVDYLPLALEQAAAYIDSAQMTLAGYVGRFHERHLELLQRGKPDTNYPDTVATTWELSFQRLEKESPGGAALLQLCAFFAPDDIPREMILAGSEHLPQSLRETVSDALAFDDAVRAIRHYSLIEAGEKDTFAIHRLVQAVIRNRLSPADRRRWVMSALSVVKTAFPFESGEVQNWKACGRLRSHAMAVAAATESINIVSEDVATLLNQVGVYALGRAEYTEAKVIFRRALEISEKTLEPNPEAIAVRTNNLGNALTELGEFADARATLEDALKIVEKAFGSDHPAFAITLNNFGTVLSETGDLRGAKAAFERALEIDERILGSDHPTVGIRINNLGDVLRELGDLAGAYAAFHRALKITEEAFGANHAKIGQCLSNLGGVLSDLGKLHDAKALYERALEIEESAFGPDDPRVAICIGNLGGVLQQLGDLRAARAAGERALKIFCTSLGESHPKTLMMRRNLASLSH